MALSKRLEFLASFHQGEGSVYDIGCDHGLLGLSFIKNQIVKDIYLVDPNPYSVDLIKESLDADIPEHVSIHPLKQSGEKTKISTFNSLIFIAGMGGKTIIDILSSWSEESLRNANQIVLSPHRNLLELREYLRQNDFKLVREEVIFEGNNFYEVIAVRKSADGKAISLYGDELWESGESANYLNHQMAFWGQHRDPRSQAYFSFLKGLVK